LGRQTTALRAFNRGLISPLALARTDIDRTAMSAETMTNWMPRNLGSMMLRPGTKYIGATASNNQAKFIPFIFSQTDTALVEITDVLMRVWASDSLTTRTAVTSAVTNGGFDSDVASWTDKDEGGTAASIWLTGGYLKLTGDGTHAAVREQEVTTVETSTEHALDIVINRGPVTLRVGSTSLGDDYINETVLGTGSHSLTFTPTGNFFIQFQNRAKRFVLVDSVAVGSSGVMSITAPWAAADLSKLRWDQSGDILYIACDGYIQYKIIRRQTTGWSVEKYEPVDGPFSDINISTITLAAAALSGDTTLTASKALFKSTDVGSLFKLTSTGQTVTASLTAQDTWTSAIKVTGTSTSRIFTQIRAGRVDSTITLQRSLDSATSGFAAVTTYTTNATITYDDTLDNQTAWYRIGIATGDYGTDTVVLTLDYAIGSIDGIGRVTGFTSSTVVDVGVIVDFGGTDATLNWYPADWSTRKGYPTAVAFTEGRLGWGGRDKVWLSVSDAYESYDPDVIGDSGTIRRTLGSGPVDRANWMIGARRLLVGTDGSENSMRSSSEDEILTPSNAMIKYFSTQGSSTVKAVSLDNNAIFVQKGGTRVFEASWGDNYDYQSNDLTVFFPEAGSSVITSLAVQRQPDTRVHCLRTDGTVMILVHEIAENVTCWCKYTSGGTVEDIVVLPGASGSAEDSVYYIINRTINSSTVRYLEKWSLESECQGGTTSKQMDSHINGTVSGGIMTGLTTLEGESVVAWVNGKNAGSGTVSSGQVTGLTSDGSGTVGISYTGQWKSSKLTYAASPNQTPLTQVKNISQLGVILYNTHYQALKYGPSFTELDDLPDVEGYTAVAADTIHSSYDEQAFEFDGRWDTDLRLCLQAQSPNPCTILAAIISVDTNEKR